MSGSARGRLAGGVLTRSVLARGVAVTVCGGRCGVLRGGWCVGVGGIRCGCLYLGRILRERRNGAEREQGNAKREVAGLNHGDCLR